MKLGLAFLVAAATMLAVTAARAGEGFDLDVEPRTLREQTGEWQLQDLAVGESGYIFGGTLCEVDGRLHVFGNAGLSEKSSFVASLRVTAMPGRRVSIKVEPEKKAAGRLTPKHLSFLTKRVNCGSLEDHWPAAAPLFRVDSINGHESLSALLAGLVEPGGGAEAEPGDAKKALNEMLAEVEEEEKKRGTGADDLLPEWRVTESRSKIDDTPSVFMSLDAIEKIAARYGTQRPSMHIRCNENTTAIYFAVEDFFMEDEATVIYRLDEAEAKTVKMPVATNRTAFGLWRGNTAIPFVKGLFSKKRMVVRVTPRNSGARTFEFALGPLEEKIAPLRKACQW